jgi:hypothetical protein
MRVFRIALLVSCCVCLPAWSDPPMHDYPTIARVEYVQECIETNGGIIANVYKCSCAIDWIAKKLTYDQFVEAQTFAKYSGLPGEGGALFRDSDEAKKKAKLFRTVEADAYKSCGLSPR